MRILILNHAERRKRFLNNIIDTIVEELHSQYSANSSVNLSSLRITTIDVNDDHEDNVLDTLLFDEPNAIIDAFSTSFVLQNLNNPSVVGSAQFYLFINSNKFSFTNIGYIANQLFIEGKVPNHLNSSEIKRICQVVLQCSERFAFAQLIQKFHKSSKIFHGFIRIDDVPLTNQSHLAVALQLLQASIPILVNVIPNLANHKTIRPWLSLKTKYPDLIEFGQHGYSHIDYAQHGKKQEFGNLRTFREQLLDILRGKLYLGQLLGDLKIRTFCPPFNSYDLNTLRALHRIGFEFLTGGQNTLPWPHKPTQIPSIVDPLRWENNHSYPGSLNHFIGQITLPVRDGRRPIIGLTLHPHKTPPETANQIIEAIIALGKEGDIRWCRADELPDVCYKLS